MVDLVLTEVQWPVDEPTPAVVNRFGDLVGQLGHTVDELLHDKGQNPGDGADPDDESSHHRQGPRYPPPVEPVHHRNKQRGTQDREPERDDDLFERLDHPHQGVEGGTDDQQAPCPFRGSPHDRMYLKSIDYTAVLGLSIAHPGNTRPETPSTRATEVVGSTPSGRPFPNRGTPAR